MDSLTQIVLGAAVGEAVAGKKAGYRAPLWGGIVATVPDLDVISSHFLDTVDALDFHRGMTHSIVFAVIISPLAGIALKRLYQSTGLSAKRWSLLVFLCLFTHALLDCFTTWGTKLFWPFTNYKVAWKSIFVIDPLYTIPLLLTLVWALLLPKTSAKRRIINYAGLSISTAYLLLAVAIKLQVNSVFEQSFARQGISVVRYDTRPSPMNIILWTANVELQDGFLIGYYSLLDENNNIDYHYFPKNHHLLAGYSEESKVQQLINIVEDWYTLEDAEKGVILNDLRFGQGVGWEKGTGEFVFAYHIFSDNGGVVIEEAEKSFRDGKKMLKPLWNRMLGN